MKQFIEAGRFVRVQDKKVVRWFARVPLLVLVGEAPGRTNGRRLPLSGPSGDRLSELMEKDVHAVTRTFNLLPSWPGQAKGGKGSSWPRDRARKMAAQFLINHGGERWTVLLLGRRVADAFGMSKISFFERVRMDEQSVIDFYVVPHPSGISHWWNKTENVWTAQVFFREIVARHDCPRG